MKLPDFKCRKLVIGDIYERTKITRVIDPVVGQAQLLGH